MRSGRKTASIAPTIRWNAADDLPHVPAVKLRGSWGSSCSPLRSSIVNRLLIVCALFFVCNRALQLSVSSSAYLSVADNDTVPIGAVFRNARWADANGVLAMRCCEHGIGTRRLRAARGEQRTLCTCIGELMSDQLGAMQPEPFSAANPVSQAILWSAASKPTANEALYRLMRLRDVRFVLGRAAESAAFGPHLRLASFGMLMVGDDNLRQLAQAVNSMLTGSALSASRGAHADNVTVYSSQLVGSILKPNFGFRCVGSDCAAEADVLRRLFDEARSSFAHAHGVGSADASVPMMVVFGGHLKALMHCSADLPRHAGNTTSGPTSAAFARLAQDAVERAMRTLAAACRGCLFVWRLEQGRASRSEVSSGCVTVGLEERSARWNAVVQRAIEASPMRQQWRIFDPEQSTSAMGDAVEGNVQCCSAARVLTAQQLLLSIGSWRKERGAAAWASAGRELDLKQEERYAAERMRAQRRVDDFPRRATAAAAPGAASGIHRLRR